MMRRIRVPLLVLIVFAVALPAGARTPLVGYHEVTNTNDSGSGTLRQAITDANNHPGPDTVAFNIPKSDPGYSSSEGVWTITPTSFLPGLIDGDTIIDGFTQTTSQGDTNPLGPEIRIDGSSLGPVAWVLSVESNANQIKGLNINGADGAGLKLASGASGNIVKDNFIGVGPNGLYPDSNGTGVEVFDGANGNVIANNVISANDRHGIMLSGSGADGNMIRRNKIGLDWLGYQDVANGEHGILIISGPAGNTVGGQPEYRNYIGENKQHGVYISAADLNEVTHNYIGLSAPQSGFILGTGNVRSGVVVDGGSYGTRIAHNLIADNGEHGVYISGSGTNNSEVQGNIIGASASLGSAYRNGKHGVGIYDGAQYNEIGDVVHSSLGNVIVGSVWSGVVIVDPGTDHNKVFRNIIGTDTTGTATDLGNGYYGVHIVGGADNEIKWNHIAFNGLFATRAGVGVVGATATSNTISQNSIHDNSGKGIELADGGNAGVSTPSIILANCELVQGISGAGWTIEVFADRDGEGGSYRGTTTASPLFTWVGSSGGPNVTVTATDLAGNTSEFSSFWPVGWCHRTSLPLVLK